MNYRNKKLTASAKHESCVACGANDGTIVWAHSNSQKHGKGMGIKAHDVFGAYLCHKCHARYDSNDKILPLGTGINLVRDVWFSIVWNKSLLIACEKGYL